MSTAAEFTSDPRIREVRVTANEIIANLADGRVISFPLAWSWQLFQATARQRANLRLIGDGRGVHWPDVDEDISVERMLHGVPAPRPRSRGPRTGGGVVRDRRSPSTRKQPTRKKTARG